MNFSLTTLPKVRPAQREATEGFQQALNGGYGRLFGAAKAHWDRHFVGKDPSDACVSVRISGGNTLGGSQQRCLGA